MRLQTHHRAPASKVMHPVTDGDLSTLRDGHVHSLRIMVLFASQTQIASCPDILPLVQTLLPRILL
jgi:hypothetical protein